tara:strand:+ start:1543 stop:1959 length:417 start_codon:yes stop_codon:yes gene_type:complete
MGNLSDVLFSFSASPGRFFVVKHTPVDEAKACEWWRHAEGLFNDPVAFQKVFEKQFALGFVNHYFLPEKAGDGAAPALCVWESKSPVDVETFRKFIDGPDGPFPNGEFVNDVYAVAPGATVPGTGFLAPLDPYAVSSF